MTVPVHTVVRVQADMVDGRPVHEELLVETIDEGYRLVKSPGLVLGLAAGDVISVNSDCRYALVRRGRNVCVQMFAKERLREIESLASNLMSEVAGRLDGKGPFELVYTIPVDVGFIRIEKVLGRVVEEFRQVEWVYGNVYDVDGTTPLGWWVP